MSRRLIRYLGKKAGLHPVVSLTLALLATIAAGIGAYTRLNIEMDVAALLPKDSQVYQQRAKAEWLFGLGNYDFLLCALEVKDDAPPEVAEDASERLVAISDEMEQALDDPRYFTRRADRLRPREFSGLQGNEAALVALLTDGDLDRLEERLAPDRLGGSITRIAEQLESGITTETLVQIRRDPFGLESLLESRSVFVAGPLKANFREGHYISEDGQMLLLVLWPVEPSTNLVHSRNLMQFLDETREALYRRNPGWSDWLRISYVGPHVENAEGTADVRQDILLSSIVSFIAVMVLFVGAFRQPEALAFVAIPLIVGLIWTLGFTSLFVTRITQVTLTFAAILIGLGIDFSIHLYNRYLEDIRLGHSTEFALTNAIYNTGPSIFAGAVTTGLAFFGMALTEFEGFRELGLFGGIGILMSLLAVVTILPPLMVIFSSFSRQMRGPLATLGLKKVTFMVQSYPRMSVAAGMCIVVFLGMHATEAGFDEDFQTLRQPSDSYLELIDRINSHFELPSNQVLVLVEGDAVNSALRANDRVYQNIQSARAAYDLVALDSLRTIYPAPETQLRSLNRFLSLPEDRIAREIQNQKQRNPAIPSEFFQPFLDRYSQIRLQASVALESGNHPIGFDRIYDPEFVDVVFYYLAQDAEKGVYRVATRIYPPQEDIWREEVPPQFMETLRDGLEKEPTVLGNAVLSSELQTIIVNDLTRLVLIVFFSVTAYLAFYFRSIFRAGLAMIPVVFALLCMLGMVRLLGMRLNYMNIIAIPMIVGIGVDSAIHLLGRFYEGEQHNMRLAVEKTGRAIVITSLTTIFGFGALSVASFSGIREIGILSIIGVLATLFGALVFLPAILRLLDPRYTYTGGPGDEIG